MQTTQNNRKKTLDNLPAHYTQQLKSPAEKKAELAKIKVDSRLRNLAFYYLARREYSAKELQAKLQKKLQIKPSVKSANKPATKPIAEQNDTANLTTSATTVLQHSTSHTHDDGCEFMYSQEQITALLEEFAEKGYQSDMRTALMLIREGIRKGRGKNRIKQDFKQRCLSLPYSIDELMELAYDDMPTDPNHSVDWLTLAVQARVKKYGEQIPKDYQQKAKQLRFLQYRGFETHVCFDALNHNMDTLIDTLVDKA